MSEGFNRNLILEEVLVGNKFQERVVDKGLGELCREGKTSWEVSDRFEIIASEFYCRHLMFWRFRCSSSFDF